MGGGRGADSELQAYLALHPMKVTASMATAQPSTRAVKARILGNAQQGISNHCFVH